MKRIRLISVLLICSLIFLTFANLLSAEGIHKQTTLTSSILKTREKKQWTNSLFNNPPNPPLIIGPITGKIKKNYTYNFSISDPDDDLLINLEVKWGDGTESLKCCETWESGSTITVSHIWTKKGTYNISARISDIFGIYSDWSESLVVGMPKLLNIKMVQLRDMFMGNYL
jgi:hypothetical protein